MAEVTFIHVVAVVTVRSPHVNRDLLGKDTDVFTCKKFSVHSHSCINDILKTRMQLSPAQSGYFLKWRVVLAGPQKGIFLHVFKVNLKIGID